MNKNRFKIIFLSVIVLLLSGSSLLLPIFSSRVSARAPGATDPGPQVATKYLYVPFTYSRTKPVMKDGSGCDITLVLGATSYAGCKDIASGVGVYNYVGNHNPERANISSVVLIDQQTKDVLNPSWGLVSGGMRIYGLEKGHVYTGYFIYDDKDSSDIKKLTGQVSKYCLLGGQTTLVKGEEAAFAIAHGLVNGCSRYGSEPFLPAALNPVNLNGGESFKYSKDITNLKAATISAPDPATADDQASEDEPDPCKVPEGTTMRWLSCAFISWGENATNLLDKTIQNFLFTPPEQIFTDQMHTAWSTFRTVGVILILIAGLAMVISQAAGMDIFDAYTVKKVLPRLVIAAIGITLSWPILRFMIVLFNDLGVWAHDIILYPFQGLDNNAGTSIVTGGTLAVTGFLGYLILLAGPTGTAALLGTIALGLLIGLLVLALRQMVILVAVLMAPLAIAAYILPGTQKLWEFWKNAFLTALYMFPIIMGFIAAGKAMAGVAASVDDSPEMHLLSVLLYFAPYFLLPFAFKLAGGLMATVFSIANDRGRGGFDRLRNIRQGSASRNLSGIKNFSRFSEKSAVGRRANDILGAAANPGSMVHGRSGVRARRMALQTAQGAQLEKDNAIWQANMNDDNFLLAAANRDLAQQKLASAQSKVQTATTDDERLSAQQEVFARQRGLDAANQLPMNIRNTRATRMKALTSLSKTGYQFDGGEEGYKQLSSTVESIVGGDQRARAAAMDENQFYLKNAGRFDLGGINHGAGYSYEIGIGKSSGYVAGNAKKETWTAGAENFLGKGTGSSKLSAQQTADLIAQSGKSWDDVLRWHGMLADGIQSPNQANKDEINRQMQAVMEYANRYGDAGVQKRLADEQLRARRGIDPNFIENQ